MLHFLNDYKLLYIDIINSKYKTNQLIIYQPINYNVLLKINLPSSTSWNQL